jgi:hypothetical protein
MSLVNDLTSSLGIPGGFALLATAIFVGCKEVEKSASSHALIDITKKLKDTSWQGSLRPSLIIEQMFVWTFGERHFSRKCIRRSMAASLVFMLSLAIMSVAHGYAHSGRLDISVPTLEEHEPFVLNFVMAILGGLIPDYLALGKSRVLIRFTSLIDYGPSILLAIALDIMFSCLLSLFTIGSVFLCYTAGFSFLIEVLSKAPVLVAEHLVMHTAGFVREYLSSRSPMPVFGVLFFSTLFTSVWTFLIFLSVVVIKLLAPLQRFTSWFFDIEHHPVKAIGTVSAALVMIVGLIGTMLRLII